MTRREAWGYRCLTLTRKNKQMLIVTDVYEHFVFDSAHLRAPNLLYSPVLFVCKEIDDKLWAQLFELVKARKMIKWYHNNVLHATEDICTPYQAAYYEALHDNEAALKKQLQPMANAFCIAYKGYSLN